jgi:hypothetical protein
LSVPPNALPTERISSSGNDSMAKDRGAGRFVHRRAGAERTLLVPGGSRRRAPSDDAQVQAGDAAALRNFACIEMICPVPAGLRLARKVDREERLDPPRTLS